MVGFGETHTTKMKIAAKHIMSSKRKSLLILYSLVEAMLIIDHSFLSVCHLSISPLNNVNVCVRLYDVFYVVYSAGDAIITMLVSCSCVYRL